MVWIGVAVGLGEGGVDTVEDGLRETDVEVLGATTALTVRDTVLEVAVFAPKSVTLQ